jgi:hypothetical protein
VAHRTHGHGASEYTAAEVAKGAADRAGRVEAIDARSRSVAVVAHGTCAHGTSKISQIVVATATPKDRNALRF